jgi:integrase
MVICVLTSCRYGELCRLKVADYNPDVGTLTIREGKSEHVRHVTLTDEAPELIERLIAGRLPQDSLLVRDEASFAISRATRSRDCSMARADRDRTAWLG